MLQTAFNSETVFVVNDAWNDGSPFAVKFSLLRDTQTSLTRHEARRPYSGSLRAEQVSYGCYVLEEDLRGLIGQLRQLKDEKVVIPFWPAIAAWEDRAGQNIKGGLMVVWKEDWSQYEVYEAGSEPGWPAAEDLCAPALMGFLKPGTGGNAMSLLDVTQGYWSVQFVESSPSAYALQVTGSGYADGPQPAGYASAPKLLPIVPDFTDLAEGLNVEVGRTPVGLDREQGSTFYPHDVYRSQTAQYTLQGLSQTGQDEIADLLAWFREQGGPGASFWGRSGVVAAVLGQDELAAATTLHLEDVLALQPGDWLWADTNVASGFAKANTIVGDTITLVAAFGFALPNGWPLYALHLARLDKPELRVSWKRPGLAQLNIDWTEVRPEAVVPGDETVGTTLGKLAQRVVLFQFTRDLMNGTVLRWYYTSFEEDISWGGHDYLHGPFQCGDVTTSLNLEDDVCEVQSFILSGNPLVEEIAMTSETPVSVAITFADYYGAISNAAAVFQGDCTSIKREGNKLTAKCKVGPAIFDTQLPRFVRGPMCNHIGGSNNGGTFLISAGCTLLRANFKFSATVANPISAAFPATLAIATLTGVGASAIAATVISNYFANGVVEWGAGADIKRRLIIGSTVPAAGALSLTLHRYFTALPGLGDAVALYPGCDGLFTTCKAYNAVTNPRGKFNNAVNFGGEPFTPVSNPSTTGLPQFGMAGGKK